MQAPGSGGGGAVRVFNDEWLRHTVEELVGPEKVLEIREAAENYTSLWSAVTELKLTTDEALLSSLATRFRLKLADLSQSDRAARDLVPEGVARRYQILPVSVSDSVLEIATANPFDFDCEKTLAFATGREVRSLLASPRAIRDKIDEFYKPENVLTQLLEGMESIAEIRQLEDEQEAEDLKISAEEASQRPVVRLVDLILSEGITARSSDIHIEPEEGGVAVRYRIDGVLRQVMKIPRAAGLPLISRIKIMSGLDIADRLRPQDGRARVSINNDKIDLRISTPCGS